MNRSRGRNEKKESSFSAYDASLFVLTIIGATIALARYAIIVNDRMVMENEIETLEVETRKAKYEADFLDVDWQTKREEKLKAFNKRGYEPVTSADRIQ